MSYINAMRPLTQIRLGETSNIIGLPGMAKPGSLAWISWVTVHDIEEATPRLALKLYFYRFGKTGKGRVEIRKVLVDLITTVPAIVPVVESKPFDVNTLEGERFLAWGGAAACYIKKIEEKCRVPVVKMLQPEANSFNTMYSISARYEENAQHCLDTYTTPQFRVSFLTKLRKLQCFLRGLDKQHRHNLCLSVNQAIKNKTKKAGKYVL